MLKWVGGIISGVVSAVLVFWLTEGIKDGSRPGLDNRARANIPREEQQPRPPPPPQPSISGRYVGAVVLVGVDPFDISRNFQSNHGATLDAVPTSATGFSGTLVLGSGGYATRYAVTEGVVRGNSVAFKAWCQGCSDAVVFAGSFASATRIAGMTWTSGPSEAEALRSRPPGSPLVPRGRFDLAK